MPLLHGLGRLWYDESFQKLLETWVKLMRTVRKWPCSIKVHDIDIHQVFVQMRQLSCTRTNVFAFHLTLGTKKLKLTETNESNSCVLPYHIYTRLIVGAQFLDFCSLWCSGSLFSTYTDRGSKSARSETCNEILYTSVIITL